jgi:outer membrane protein
MMGGLLHAGLLLLSLAALSAGAEPLPLWEVGAGIAAVNFPDYRGSDQRHTWVLPVPYFVYRGEFLQVDERRMRGLFLKTEKAELDVSVNGSVPVKSNDNESRRGMPDLDPTLEIGPSLNFFLFRSEDKKRRLELRLPVRAVIASDFSHVRSAGWVFQPNLNLDVRDPLGYQGWNLGLLGGPLFSDRRYNRYFYAVDPAFATADRPAYTAGGGYAGTQFIAALSKRHRDFWAGGFVKWDTLNNAAFADSPLVKTRQYFAAGFAVAWILGESKTTVEATR